MHVLTLALVGVLEGGPAPRSVKVERFALLAVAPGCVVSAVAHQLAAVPARGRALGRVAVALAAAADGQIGHGVVVAEVLEGRLLGVVERRQQVAAQRLLGRLLQRLRRVQPVEHHLDVRRGHPVLYLYTAMRSVLIALRVRFSSGRKLIAICINHKFDTFSDFSSSKEV